jgi:hypothetical protein
MLGLALAALVAAGTGTAIDNRPMDEESVKKTLTGTAAGAFLMGSCSSVFNLRDRANGHAPRLSTASCLGATLAASTLIYGYKEAVYDPRVHQGGHITPKGRRDFVEGVGGTAAGAMLFVPIAEW